MKRRPSGSPALARSRKTGRRSPSRLLAGLAPYQVAVPQLRQVKEYLARHTELGALLPELSEQARKEFGRDAELSLEFYKDPEIDDQYLTLYVRQARYDTAIMARIDRVSRPFAEKLEQASGYLLVTTDFRQPGGGNEV